MAESTDNRRSKNFSIKEDKFLEYFNKELRSHVTFIVGDNRTRIPGHKSVLSSCSYEFFNAFNNIILDKDEFSIEDVEEKDFLAFLRFCYTARVQLSFPVDVWAVLKLAHRFQVKQLMEKCEDILNFRLDYTNYWEYFSKSYFLSQDSMLKKKILKRIEMGEFGRVSGNSRAKLDNFPLEDLAAFIDLDHVNCDEMEMFDLVMKWAKINCEKKKIPTDSKNLRRILGDVFFKIRFPTMKAEWFVEILSEYPDLFTKQEIMDISGNILKKDKSSSKFSHKLRKCDYAHVRYHLLHAYWNGYRKCFQRFDPLILQELLAISKEQKQQKTKGKNWLRRN